MQIQRNCHLSYFLFAKQIEIITLKKLSIQNHCGPLWWEKVGSGAKQPKLGDSESFQAIFMGKYWENYKLAKMWHFE